jgi:hypothetical protein
MTREEKINALINHELDTFTVSFFEEILRYGCKGFEEILRYGCKGFDELTDEEIDAEYKSIFEEDE